ncbi:MAG: hypothetical protein AVDCRST_MAG06-2055, partial [uncultured Nocardioides sp.]
PSCWPAGGQHANAPLPPDSVHPGVHAHAAM